MDGRMFDGLINTFVVGGCLLIVGWAALLVLVAVLLLRWAFA